MPYLEVEDICLYYEERGSGDPLILMHGALGSIDQPDESWTTIMELVAKKYRAIQIEYRGHGRTNNSRDYLTYELIAEDVCKFIELMQIKPAHIAGLSDGAIVASQIGMSNPEFARTLICVGANYYNDELVKQANKAINLKAYEEEAPKYASRLAMIHDRNKEPGYWRKLVVQLEKNLAANPKYSIADLKKISVPTLLLSGENDLWANPKQMFEMRQNIPNSEMLIINNAGHTIQSSHAHIVGPVVMDFIDRHSVNL